ncbi:MAG: hypothetical protein AAF363_12820 [Bacteroidota bacterium]
MELDELKEIWNKQNDKPMYTVNQNALFNSIQRSKDKSLKISNISELLILFVNLFTGLFLLSMAFHKDAHDLTIYLMSSGLLLSVPIVLWFRYKRLKGRDNFERSMSGTLDKAISTAHYQVQFSRWVRFYALGMLLIVVFGIFENDKSFIYIIFISVVVILTFYGSRWEHGIYVRRKEKLVELKKKLENENTDTFDQLR